MTEEQYDTVVVGGGVSGVCAAVTSSRKGLRTLLIEKHKELGGTVLAGFQNYICGLYANDVSNPFTILNNGLSTEVVALLDRRLPGDNRVRMGKVEVHSFRSTNMQSVFTELTDAERNLEIRLSTEITGVDKSGSSISRLNLDHANESVRPEHVIDCSGGSIIKMAEACAKESPDQEHQLFGGCVCLGNIDYIDDQLPIKVPFAIRRAVEAGALDERLLVTTFTPDELNSAGICRMNIDPDDLSSDGMTIHDLFAILHNFLSDTIQEFKQSTITATSPELLDRGGSVLDGEYRLTSEDVTTAASFDDAVARAAWPIEFWHRQKGPSYTYLDSGSYYEIPGRCLVSKDINNLYAAGRCISADSQAQASCRVIGTCMALGNAAANMIYKNRSRSV